MPSSATGQPAGRSEDLLHRAVLATTLVLSCLTGFATSYLLLVLAVIAAGYLLLRRAGFVFDGAGRLFVAAFVGLAILFALSAERPADVLFAINFVAFLAYVPLATLLGRAAGPGNTQTVARLALAGAAIGCAGSLVDVYVFHSARAGTLWLITDTVRLGNTAVLLGFLSLIGLAQPGDRRRWLFLLGPVLAAIVALLTGTRGAMFAIPVLAVGSVFLIVRNKWIAAVLGAGVVAGLLAAGFSGIIDNGRLDAMIGVFRELADGAPVTDEAMAIRFKLYEAGWQAFEQSPLFGHGWARLMSSVEPFLAGADKTYAKLPHLHNEVLNFAVFGGVAGVAIYLVLIAMPIIIALRSRRDGQYRARLAGTGILALGYVVLGLPDTMLSFDLHTALYVALVATLLAYCRDGREPEAA
jgi:O-antigen ligase